MVTVQPDVLDVELIDVDEVFFLPKAQVEKSPAILKLFLKHRKISKSKAVAEELRSVS